MTLTQSFKTIIFLYIQVGHGLHHAMVESQIDHINRACKWLSDVCTFMAYSWPTWIETCPWVLSISPRRAWMREDLPAPTVPTTATSSPAITSKSTLYSGTKVKGSLFSIHLLIKEKLRKIVWRSFNMAFCNYMHVQQYTWLNYSFFLRLVLFICRLPTQVQSWHKTNEQTE